MGDGGDVIENKMKFDLFNSWRLNIYIEYI